MSNPQERPNKTDNPSPFTLRRARDPDPTSPSAPARPQQEAWHPDTKTASFDESVRDDDAFLRRLAQPIPDPPPSTAGRRFAVFGLVALTALVSVGATFLVLRYFSGQPATGAGGPGTSLAARPLSSGSSEFARVGSSLPQFTVAPTPLLAVDERAVLGVSVYGARENNEFVIRGVIPGSMLSMGRPLGADGWAIPASKIGGAMLTPPRGFVGAMDLVLELRLASGSVADRKALRMEWTDSSASVQTRRIEVATAVPAAALPGLVAAAPVRGVTDAEIRFGISAPFSGSARELGRQMKLGIETAFGEINGSGGVYGRQLRLVAADDGYEPSRTADTMKQLYDKDQVFAIVGNVGTPTAAVALPYALEQRMLFFGAFTGASLLRRDPPDRYVFNYRASYVEETEAVVRYLVKVRRVRPEDIVVFAQQDTFGDAGYAGVARAMRALRGGEEVTIPRLNYTRNSVDVTDAVAQLRARKTSTKAVVMVATYRAAAKFIEKTRDLYPDMIYTNVSFVGSTALAEELMLLGSRYATGVIVTQVVPAVNSYSSLVLAYKAALAKYFPGEAADYVSLEGYVAAKVLEEGLKRTGPQLDTERLVEGLESVRNLDLGLGTPLTFGRAEHQASRKVWGTQLDVNGRYEAIDLQ